MLRAKLKHDHKVNSLLRTYIMGNGLVSLFISQTS